MGSTPDTFTIEFTRDERLVDDSGTRQAETPEDERCPATNQSRRSLMARWLESAPPLKHFLHRSTTLSASVALNQYLPGFIGSVASLTLLIYTARFSTSKNRMCRMMMGIQKSYTMATMIFGSVENHHVVVMLGCWLGYYGVFCDDDEVTISTTSDGRQEKTLLYIL